MSDATSPCPDCGDTDLRKLNSGVFLCWGCGEKRAYDCPRCGYIPRSTDELDTEAGGHADVSWYTCPECGKQTGNQGWAV